MYDLTADQIILGIFVNKQDWYKAGDNKIGQAQGHPQSNKCCRGLCFLCRFFRYNGEYKLRDEVRRVYGLEPIDRGVYEKELLKIDERVNILNMVFSGRFIEDHPNPDDPNNTWLSIP